MSTHVHSYLIRALVQFCCIYFIYFLFINLFILLLVIEPRTLLLCMLEKIAPLSSTSILIFFFFLVGMGLGGRVLLCNPGWNSPAKLVLNLQYQLFGSCRYFTLIYFSVLCRKRKSCNLITTVQSSLLRKLVVISY